MVIERYLSSRAAHLTRQYLAFGTYRPKRPPAPQNDRPCLLYVHIPFCRELCPYCSFVRVKFEPSLASRYFDVLIREIELYRDCGYQFDSVYIGGGTPTVMPDRLAETISFLRETWPITQLSVETNPNHLVPEIVEMLRSVGTTRLSVGVQSFDDRVLDSIQRLKEYGSGEQARKMLASVIGRFDTVNIDLIFNFPDQTEEMLAADIRAIKEVGADQVTYYPLMVSDSAMTEAGRRRNGTTCGREKRFYRRIVEELSGVYSQESVWCFSRRKGAIDEYIVNREEYAGVGAGACGYLGGAMHLNALSVEKYMDVILRGRSGIVGTRRFSRMERARYQLLLKLLRGRVSIEEMKDGCGNRAWLYLGGALLLMMMAGAVRFRGGDVILTPRGRYYWLVLMRTVFSVVGDFRKAHGQMECGPQADPERDSASRSPVLAAGAGG